MTMTPVTSALNINAIDICLLKKKFTEVTLISDFFNKIKINQKSND